jgi:nucleotide-binding universal stress UspA family protein
MLDRVLLPIDFSEQSMMMFDCALDLKKLGSKRITLLHVKPRGKVLLTEDKKKLELLVDRLHDAGFDASSVIREGDPSSIILEEADSEHVDIIIMASAGKGKAEELLIGSVSMGVIRRSAKPILIDKFPVMQVNGKIKECRQGQHLFRHALVSVDIPLCSMNLETVFKALCERGLKEATLLHIIDSAKYKIGDDNRFAYVKRMLDEMKARIDSPCKIATHVHYGTTAYNILETIREVDPSIVVIGTKRSSYLRGMTLGTTTEEVVRRSPIPLLIVPC